jgi:LAO/AO transport system kinase
MLRPLPPAESLIAAIQGGDRAALGRTITFLESTRPEHLHLARAVISGLEAQCSASAPPTLRIGITGPPGVGKSTLIEALGLHILSKGHRIAVLAIDPSSSVSGGSILGDKTRMEQLSVHPQAFIRPSPSGATLGGVARKTRETVSLVEAAGYNIVLIETVGTGQSETAVHSMTDLFLLLLLPGAGDELQGIKRGIVEMADLLAVNKADGERLKIAQQARVHYLNATHLLPAKNSGWIPRVLQCSALENTGIAELWAAIRAFETETRQSGWLRQNRRTQARQWLHEAIQQGLQALLEENQEVQRLLPLLEEQTAAGEISPFTAAERILQIIGKGSI